MKRFSASLHILPHVKQRTAPFANIESCADGARDVRLGVLNGDGQGFSLCKAAGDCRRERTARAMRILVVDARLLVPTRLAV